MNSSVFCLSYFGRVTIRIIFVLEGNSCILIREFSWTYFTLTTSYCYFDYIVFTEYSIKGITKCTKSSNYKIVLILPIILIIIFINDSSFSSFLSYKISIGESISSYITTIVGCLYRIVVYIAVFCNFLRTI